ncbi:cob(I)yrinic acid a,c-diamide adenosyltransferase [candidate division KSB1 bacterium]|nr:cob(I)yrinic acid a,c-diamide adenosyltransferase [candidate division KSB1 bacterium]
MKKHSITTKRGDDGTTGLLGPRAAKFDTRLETLGALDEAAAFIGLARAKSSVQMTRTLLLTIQHHLYLLNAELACPVENMHLLKMKLTKEHLGRLEEPARTIEDELNLPDKFVLYGQSETSACLDIARAVVRRAERRIVELNQAEKFSNLTILPYINRLSDMLFLLARYEEFKNGIKYAHPYDDE